VRGTLKSGQKATTREADYGRQSRICKRRRYARRWEAAKQWSTDERLHIIIAFALFCADPQGERIAAFAFADCFP